MVLLPAAAISLRVLGLGRTRALLLGTGTTGARHDLPAAQATARIVHGAAPWSPLHANCLPRALVLCRLLRRQGLEAELRLGAGRPDGIFAAHAWVEHAGEALAEPEARSRQFAVFNMPSPHGGA